jgi:hypothetical protein
VPHLSEQRGERLAQDRGPPDHDERRACGRGVARGSVSLAQSPARTIALDGEPQLATHGETDARGFGRFSPEHDERRTVDPLAPLEERLEFGAGG